MDSNVLIALMGFVSTLAAAFGTKWLDYRHQDRVRERDQRREAHTAFLNRVNRLLGAGEAITRGGPGAPITGIMQAEFREAVLNTVDSFNGLEFVSTPTTYDLAVKIMQAVHADRLLKPEEFEGVMRAVAEASRIYRDAVKVELR